MEDVFCLQAGTAISFPSKQWIFVSHEDQDYSVREKAVSWKQQHARQCASLSPSTAVLGHFKCEPLLSYCTSEISLLRSMKLKSSKWDENGILKLTNSIKVAYIRIVFLLAHGVLKGNSPSKRKATKYRIWLIAKKVWCGTHALVWEQVMGKNPC